eukprot:m.27120 g.27120  ORF g.27120 m.27120 type:complete len:119 (-) comp4382_c0_seq1:727-1083(-)
MINMLLVLALLAGTATAAVCNGGPAYYNATACAGNFTCCEFHWAPNGYGCCPFPNAVCCGNGYTCCPAGTHCVDQGSGWGVTTTCENNAGQGKPLIALTRNRFACFPIHHFAYNPLGA